MKKTENLLKFILKNRKQPFTNNNNNKEPVNIICKNVCLFTNARDEKHIREWAAHHLLIGFDRIFIFDHKSKTSLKEVFKNFDKRVKIINASDMDKSIKLPLMGKSIDIANFLKMDWMIYLDADEYIILNKYKNIKECLSIYNHADSLAINWLMFGSNYLKTDPDGLIIENYTRSDLILHSHVKTFVRPSKILGVATNPHHYNMKDNNRYYGINNVRLVNNFHINNSNVIEYYKTPVYIAHYCTQSEETYSNRKVNLPRDDTGTNRPSHYIEEIHNQYNLFENTYPKNKYAEDIKNFLKIYGHEY
jgi:hypothetical protein